VVAAVPSRFQVAVIYLRFGVEHIWPIGKLVLRSAGAFIAAMGVWFLWRALA
jgi:hypothetical protein